RHRHERRPFDDTPLDAVPARAGARLLPRPIQTSTETSTARPPPGKRSWDGSRHPDRSVAGTFPTSRPSPAGPLHPRFEDACNSLPSALPDGDGPRARAERFPALLAGWTDG